MGRRAICCLLRAKSDGAPLVGPGLGACPARSALDKLGVRVEGLILITAAASSSASDVPVNS